MNLSKTLAAAAGAAVAVAVTWECLERVKARSKLVRFELDVSTVSNNKIESSRDSGLVVGIVGAGLSGALLAALLGNDNNVSEIHVWERRIDPRALSANDAAEGRHVGLDMSKRGQRAIRQAVGSDEELQQLLRSCQVKMQGKIFHGPNNDKRYVKRSGHATDRHDLQVQ